MDKPEVACTLSFCCLYRKENINIFRYFVAVFNKTIISLALVGYVMIIANSRHVEYLPSHIQCALVE